VGILLSRLDEDEAADPWSRIWLELATSVRASYVAADPSKAPALGSESSNDPRALRPTGGHRNGATRTARRHVGIHAHLVFQVPETYKKSLTPSSRLWVRGRVPLQPKRCGSNCRNRSHRRHHAATREAEAFRQPPTRCG
jgi:hypothetical protein